MMSQSIRYLGRAETPSFYLHAKKKYDGAGIKVLINRLTLSLIAAEPVWLLMFPLGVFNDRV